MASGSQNMTTYNARTVTGSNSAASPAGALLLSGAHRANNATGDTWIFLDSYEGTSAPWGIKHDQANNKIQIFGAGTNSVWTEMDTGNTYIGGSLNTGSTLTVRAQNDMHEGGEIVLSPATDSFSTIHIDAYDSMFRLHDGTNERFKVDISTGNATINGNLGIGADYAVLGGSYKLYVNGSSFFNDHMYLAAEKHIYMSYDSTNYNILHNHNNGNISINAASGGLYVGYYNTALVNWMNGRMQLLDGCLSIFPNSGNYREGVRIHATGNWSDITLCGNDNTGDTGTSANSWFIGNNNGNFYISRNASSGGSGLRCVSNMWSVANMSTSSAAYSTAALQIREYNHGGAQSDNWQTAPRLGFHWSNRNAAQIGLASNGYLYECPSTGATFYKLVYESGTWGISISGNAATATALYTGGPSNTSASDQNARIREAIKAYFNANKASIPRNKTISLYVSTGNGEQATGYFLSGYDSSPYGGFFVCHYDTPRYVGISNGSYSCHELVRNDSRTYSINVSGSAGSVAWANVGSKPATATRWPAWSEVTSKPSTFSPSAHTDHTSIELRPGSTSAGHGGFIDFHFNNSSADYTSRIIEWSSGTLTVYTNLSATKIYNAVWNDFAEYRESDIYEGGRVLVSNGSGKLVLSTERLQPTAHVISDTFGCSVGQSDSAKTPIGVAGRVLAYTYQDRNNYKVGDAVCAAPNGTIDIMTREEIIQYPDRIIGIVDEIPNYEIWHQVSTQYDGNGNYGGHHEAEVEVKNRIWIYVR